MQAGCVFQSAVTAWNASHAALLQRTRWFTFHQYNIWLLVHGHTCKPTPTQCYRYIAIIIIIHNIYITPCYHVTPSLSHTCINTYMYMYMCRTHSGFPSTMWWPATVRLRSNRTQRHLNTNMCMQESLYMYSLTCTSTSLPPFPHSIIGAAIILCVCMCIIRVHVSFDLHMTVTHVRGISYALP